MAKLSDEEMLALIEADPLAALCRLVEEAGLTMRLYGVPVTEQQLRAEVSAATDENIDLAICRGLKGKMTDTEKLKLLLEKCEQIIPYVTATLPYESQAMKKHNVTCSDPEWVAIHGGRAVSSTRQLNSLMKLVEELKKP